MLTSKSCLSYVLCCNLVNISRRMKSKVSFRIEILFFCTCSRTWENCKKKLGPMIWDTLYVINLYRVGIYAKLKSSSPGLVMLPLSKLSEVRSKWFQLPASLMLWLNYIMHLKVNRQSKGVIPHHAWRVLNLKCHVQERDHHQPASFTCWS